MFAPKSGSNQIKQDLNRQKQFKWLKQTTGVPQDLCSFSLYFHTDGEILQCIWKVNGAARTNMEYKKEERKKISIN